MRKPVETEIISSSVNLKISRNQINKTDSISSEQDREVQQVSLRHVMCSFQGIYINTAFVSYKKRIFNKRVCVLFHSFVAL